ncbi:hypothetical protein T11_16920 [Trichinella zimbabwensis]|uniref:Uncharacterized protein n=1 Tax=Trichinella zimbabwensis TaxID=268475 RepID=A0A0V1HSG8_9BILA|nr:hypothetical protein T11_16920 [Trichinella zimbabwensis]
MSRRNKFQRSFLHCILKIICCSSTYPALIVLYTKLNMHNSVEKNGLLLYGMICAIQNCSFQLIIGFLFIVVFI